MFDQQQGLFNATSLCVKIVGRLDISLANPLRHILSTGGGVSTEYVIDLDRVNEVFDSGLALLLMLHRRLNRDGANLRIINCSPEIARRCESIGMKVDELDFHIRAPVSHRTGTHIDTIINHSVEVTGHA